MTEPYRRKNLMWKLWMRSKLKLSTAGSWRTTDRGEGREEERGKVRFIGSEIPRGGWRLKLSQSRSSGAIMWCAHTHAHTHIHTHPQTPNHLTSTLYSVDRRWSEAIMQMSGVKCKWDWRDGKQKYWISRWLPWQLRQGNESIPGCRLAKAFLNWKIAERKRLNKNCLEIVHRV